MEGYEIARVTVQLAVNHLVANNWMMLTPIGPWEAGAFFYIPDALGRVGVTDSCIYLWVDRQGHHPDAISNVNEKEFSFSLEICVCPRSWKFCLPYY